MNIGNKIRELRKQRGITQEQLAESIGISFQAVSKWENNIALPDITLVPVLASYFGVSMDELFDFNLKEIEHAVRIITEKAYQYRESNPAESRRILEEGLKKYPENDILLNNLLYVFSLSDFCRINIILSGLEQYAVIGAFSKVVGIAALALSTLSLPFIFMRASYPMTPFAFPVAISKSFSRVTKSFSPIL